MNKNNQIIYWIIDATLFSGLICAFLMNDTGLPFRQWLGIVGGIISNYHHLANWRGVKSVFGKFIGKTAGSWRIYLSIDALMATGLITTVTTGVIISTRWNLSPTHYAVWNTFHIISSVITLLVTLIIINSHRKWIVKTAQRLSFRLSVVSPQLATVRIPAATIYRFRR